MAIREVLVSFTFEQQRQMINLIGTDVGDASLLLTPTNVVVTAINEVINGDVDLANQTIGMDDGTLASPSLFWDSGQGFYKVDANKLGLTTSLAITGDLEVDGDITFRAGSGTGGTLTFGDLNTDNIVFNADMQSSIIPDTTANYNLGSLLQQWNNLWIDGTASIDTLTVDENAQVIGHIQVDSGDIRVPNTQTTVDLFDDYATTVEAFGAATSMRFGSDFGAGTFTIRSGYINTSRPTLRVFNTIATTVEAFGAASNVTMGLSTFGTTGVNSNFNIRSDDTVLDGDLNVNGGEILSSSNTFDLLIANSDVRIGAANGAGETLINNTLKVKENLDLSNSGTNLLIKDNLVNSLVVKEGSNDYVRFTTTDADEKILIYKDVYIVGNLDISGTTTTIDTTNLLVEDKNIELGVTTAAATDAGADGGGITLKATTDKTITYNNTNGAWESNIGFDVGGGYSAATGGVSLYPAGGIISARPSSSNDYVFQGFKNGTGVTSQINADGGATFGAVPGDAITNLGTQISGDGVIDTRVGAGAAAIKVRESGSGSTNITLSGDGTATFAGDVTFGDSTATGVGVVVRESGSVVTRVDNVDPVFQAFSGGNTGADKKIEFISDGSANFASTVSTGSLDTAAAGGQGSTITGDGRMTLQFPSGGGSGVGMLAIYSGTTKNIEFFSGGFASFNANIDVGTNSATTDSDHTVDAGLYGMYSITASFTTTRNINVQNLTDGRKVIIHVRNTNGTQRTLNILASETSTGFAAVNMMPSSPGGPSVTAGQIGATSGTLFMTIANINGTFCGHFG